MQGIAIAWKRTRFDPSAMHSVPNRITNLAETIQIMKLNSLMPNPRKTSCVHLLILGHKWSCTCAGYASLGQERSRLNLHPEVSEAGLW